MISNIIIDVNNPEALDCKAESAGFPVFQDKYVLQRVDDSKPGGHPPARGENENHWLHWQSHHVEQCILDRQVYSSLNI